MRVMRGIQLVAVVAASVFVLAGCPASLSGNVYSRNEARMTQDVQYGTVESVRHVLIEGTKSGVGTIAGAALGGIAGSTIGGGRGAAVAAVGGAVLGGLAGSAAEENATRQPGLEITVRLDSGHTIAVTQAADTAFAPGDRVRVITAADGTTRVTH